MSKTTAIAALLLLASSLAGCTDPSPSYETGLLTVGSVFSYETEERKEFAFHKEIVNATLNVTMEAHYGSDDGSLVVWLDHVNRRRVDDGETVSFADGEILGKRSDLCVTDGPLLASMTCRRNLTVQGLQHEIVSEGASGSRTFQFQRFPSGSLVASLPLDQWVPRPGSGDRFFVQEDRGALLLKGVGDLPGYRNASEWTARYESGVPVPTEFAINITHSAASARPLDYSGSVTGRLSKWVPGQGEPIREQWPIPVPEEAREPITDWLDLVPAHTPGIRFPLSDAWNETQLYEPRVVDFVADNEILVPARLLYREIVEDGYKIALEWNMTFCNDDGSCRSSVVGKRLQPMNLSTTYTNAGGEPIGGEPLGQGEFTGKPFARSDQELILRRPPPMASVLETWLESIQLPVRLLDLDFASIETETEPGEPRIYERVEIVIMHGSSMRRTELGHNRESYRLAVSHFGAIDGRVILLLVPKEPVPEHWARSEPSMPQPS